MVFDECAPGKARHEDAQKSMELTARWARRSRERFDSLQRSRLIPTESCEGLSGAQALFGIVQGAAHLDLRGESLERTQQIGFDGYAIGGLSVGEEKGVMWHVVGELAPLMPADRRALFNGRGTPEDLLEAVALGVDMFDCVLPRAMVGTARPSRREES